jgi:Short C-terminal domain
MMRRRPLMRAAATTAVVAGTATAVSGRVSRRQQGKAQEQADAQAYEQQQAAVAQQAAAPLPAPAPAPAPVSAGLSPEAIQQLQSLAALKEQGVLTEEEFNAQKALILS